jgi:hypothetical protein
MAGLPYSLLGLSPGGSQDLQMQGFSHDNTFPWSAPYGVAASDISPGGETGM